MTNDQLRQRVAELLFNDKQLQLCFSSQPSAIYIPFGGTRESFYILVSLYLKTEYSEFESLSFVCLRTLALLKESALIGSSKGVEIVPHVMENEKPKRVLRFSVVDTALSHAVKLEAKALLNEHPAAGVTCGWYMQKPLSAN